MLETKGHPNRLGIWGWVGGGRWGVDRYLYTLHRLTGVGLLLYFLIHIIVTTSRAFGPESWEAAMGAVTGHWIFLIGEFLVFVAFAFHGANGIRLILVELGWGVGRPIEPTYPYRTSLNTQRPMSVVLMLVAAALIVAGGFEFFVLH